MGPLNIYKYISNKFFNASFDELVGTGSKSEFFTGEYALFVCPPQELRIR